MRQIAMAIQLYEQEHGCFPPAYVADENGRPMHSWRVLILPYIEEHALYQAYKFDEPWDGPNNRRLARMTPALLTSCPSWDGDSWSGTACYVAVVGPDTMWPGAGSRESGEIMDEPANTLMLVEAPDAGIHWIEPRDLTVEQLTEIAGRGVGGRGNDPHKSDSYYWWTAGWHAVFADGHVEFLNDRIPPDVLRAATTAAGGEDTPSLAEAGVVRSYVKMQPTIALIVFILVVLAPLFWLPAHVRRQQIEKAQRKEQKG